MFLLVAFIVSNLAWAGLYFAMWFHYDKRDDNRLEDIEGLEGEIDELTDVVEKSIKVIQQGAVSLEKMLQRDAEWREYVKQLTAKGPQA